MKLSVKAFKANLFKILETILSGWVAKTEGKNLRKRGLFDGKGKIKFQGDFKITDEEFLGR